MDMKDEYRSLVDEGKNLETETSRMGHAMYYAVDKIPTCQETVLAQKEGGGARERADKRTKMRL